uniref:transketolase n=1 Tax=Ndongobacter massiliensis TaxID=1871025 RepID=UPI000931A83F|nr:transketolase [Ndongobacter massiliensis]
MDKKERLALKVGSAKIRAATLKMLKWRRYGHLGGAMSIVELLSVLYNKQMKHDPKNPSWDERDYLVLSKGHAGPAWYAALATQGYFPETELYTLNEGGTNLPSHPDRTKTPGVDATTGSLGQGTSVGAGLGYATRLEGSDRHVYLVVGDGELNEGQCWEAFQFIAHYKLHETIVIIDHNKQQLDGYLEDILNPFDLAKKMEAFGFRVWTVDGMDEAAISDAIDAAKSVTGQAVCLLLETKKAQGVPYYMDRLDNHSPKFNEEADRAVEAVIADLESFIAASEQEAK